MKDQALVGWSVGERAREGCSGAERQSAEAAESGGDFGGPGPGGVQPQDVAPTGAHEVPSDVPGTVVETFGLAAGQLA